MTYIETYLNDVIAANESDAYCASILQTHSNDIDSAIGNFVHHILRNEVTGHNKRWRKEVTDHTNRWKEWIGDNDIGIFSEDDVCRFIAYEASTSWPECLEEDMEYGSNNFDLTKGYDTFMEALYVVWLNMNPTDFADWVG